MNKKSQKIPKIKAADRVKLLDVPELLVVVTITHAASVRYGHKSSWCTATSKDKHFKNYTKRAVLIYVIMYRVIDGKRTGDATTKIALHRKYRQGAKWQCHDFYDKRFDFTPLRWALDEKYNLSGIMGDYYASVRTTRKKTDRQLMDYEVGETLRGFLPGNLKLVVGKLTDRSYYSYRRRRRVSRKNLKYEEQFRANIARPDILKAEILEVKETRLRIRILEVKDPTPLFQHILANHAVEAVITRTIIPTFERLPITN